MIYCKAAGLVWFAHRPLGVLLFSNNESMKIKDSVCQYYIYQLIQNFTSY